jgi:aspartate kinase
MVNFAIYRLLAVYGLLKDVGLAYATCSPEEQVALIEQAKGIIMDVCNDHVFAAEALIQDPSLRQTLARRIEAECQELIEYIVAAKRFNLEINSRAKDRVISFGEKLACLYMTILLQDVVRLGQTLPAFPTISVPTSVLARYHMLICRPVSGCCALGS